MYRSKVLLPVLAALSLLLGAAKARAEDPPKPPPEETATAETETSTSESGTPAAANEASRFDLGPGIPNPLAPPKTEADVKNFVVAAIKANGESTGSPVSDERLKAITDSLAIKTGDDGKPDGLSQAFMQGLIEDLQRGDDVQPQFDGDGNIMGFCNNTAQLCRGNPFDSVDPAAGTQTAELPDTTPKPSPAEGAAAARSMDSPEEGTPDSGEKSAPTPDLMANNIIQNDAPVNDSQVDNFLNTLSQDQPPTSMYNGDPADHPAAGDCTTCGGTAKGGFGNGFSASNPGGPGGREVPMFEPGMDRGIAKDRLQTLQAQYQAAQSPEAIERLLRGPDPSHVPVAGIPERLGRSRSYLQALDSDNHGAQALRDPNDDGAKDRIERSLTSSAGTPMREAKETCTRTTTFGTTVRGVLVNGACR
ncbi:MAG: hypothetical protein CO113_16520 [Elusimicrobia bacterium CG_4_9_14_3_um_filter_62_55]|nr:MAG: hypothetical protein COR54_06695 [Elusimicrobia bacterium CG22_combo_CG10-13_8_21_14_all_63_91]PJA17272.1 MAG: hypothetical protein COX66_05145 [Elusimicrobia bacterium CG_4_10_14_0_2_um_filter_63_34]PJB23847.1 MAG: hypothetical protein CO113_16520 [Elusimicrobia bacterium CG_4_9_14_3_um_filter_62_55]